MRDLFTLLLHSLDVVRCAWAVVTLGLWVFKSFMMPLRPFKNLQSMVFGSTCPMVVHQPHAGRRAPVRTHVGDDPHEAPVEASEQPESEAPTNDPSVDPDTLQVLPRRRRRRCRAVVEQPSSTKKKLQLRPLAGDLSQFLRWRSTSPIQLSLGTGSSRPFDSCWMNGGRNVHLAVTQLLGTVGAAQRSM